MLCDFYNEKLEYQENLLTYYLTKHGHEVSVVTSTFDSVFDYYGGKHDKSWPERTYFDGKAKIMKLRYRYNLLNKIRPFTSIYAILEKEAPDLIYVHDIIPNMLEAVKYVKKHPNCKMIMDYHADYSNSGKNYLSLKILHGVIRKWYLDRTRPYLSKIFPIVPAGFKFLNEIYGVPMEEMELLPLGGDIDFGLKSKASPELSDLRKKYKIGEHTKVIFTGGKLNPKKKTELVIKAVKNSQNKDICLLIIGEEAPEDADYKQMLIEESRDCPNIHFVGWLDKKGVYEHLAISSIGIFPAGQSIIWQQLISMGLPLVAGNIGEQSIEYLNLYNNIVIMEKDEISQANIEKHLNQILFDEPTYRKMSEGAQKVGQECLNWNVLIDKLLRFNQFD